MLAKLNEGIYRQSPLVLYMCTKTCEKAVTEKIFKNQIFLCYGFFACFHSLHSYMLYIFWGLNMSVVYIIDCIVPNRSKVGHNPKSQIVQRHSIECQTIE